MSQKIDLEGCVILLVEDDPMSQRIFQIFFKPTGARILLAENGLEALNVLQGGYSGYVHINIIFMDIAMPCMDGIQAARKIRAGNGEYQDIPILAWTAAWHTEMLPAGLFNQCLIKPTDKNILLEAAEKWLKLKPIKS